MIADASAKLSRFFPPKLDFMVQINNCQKCFDSAVEKLLKVDAVADSGALVACTIIQKNMDDVKLLEVFKLFLFSEDLFC